MADLTLGWTERQWRIATEWYVRNGATLPQADPDKPLAHYVAIRHEWQKYKGVRLP